MLWIRRREVPGAALVSVLWVTSTVQVITAPLGYWYTMGPWYVLSVLASCAVLAAILDARNWTYRTQAIVCVLILLMVPALVRPMTRVVAPPDAVERLARGMSQLSLMDWLAERAGDDPVACVVPHHPVKASNLWPRFWEPWLYRRAVPDEIGLQLRGRFYNDLASGSAAIVHWNPFPEQTGVDNLIAWSVDRHILSTHDADDLARELARSYRMVEWTRPVPPEVQGNRFLVRRNVTLDGSVRVLSDELITGWRQPRAPKRSH